MAQKNLNNPNKTKVKLKYVEGETHKSHSVDGAIISGTLGGKVVVRFYHDKILLPDHSYLNIETATGKVLSEEHAIPKNSSAQFERVLETSIETNIEVIQQLATLFMNHIDAMRKAKDIINTAGKENN